MIVRLVVALALVACGERGGLPDAAVHGWQQLADLPEPVSNNAVAALDGASGCVLVSAMGIDASRTAGGIHAHAWQLGATWQPLPDVPSGGRIVASAVALRDKVYVLAGYSVALDGTETSHAEVDVLDVASQMWSPGPPLPTPIDDAVAVAWRDRWIVVASGWSNIAPVATVQVFDADQGTWATATPFPGAAVFGHAAAISGDEMVLIDGVGETVTHGFRSVLQAWHAQLDPTAPTQIAWTRIADHAGPARYRAAAGSLGGTVVFHGGTADPYNYDGLSYATNQPSAPLADAVAFDVSTATWADPPPPKPTATMDHRGLVGCGTRVFTLGGMEAGPTVTPAVWSYTP